MKLLNRLPGSQSSPPGIERQILKRIPMALIGSAAVPLLLVLFTNWFPPEGPDELVAKQLLTIEIMAWSIAVTGWTAVFTVTIGCAIVWIMKGPGYVADAYQLIDADEPTEPSNHRSNTPIA